MKPFSRLHLINILLLLHVQSIDAQIISEIKYTNGALKTRYHVQKNDTFCIENFFENGKRYNTIWHDSTHHFHSNQQISHKVLPKPFEIHSMICKDYFPQFTDRRWDAHGKASDLYQYSESGQLQKQEIWQGDSIYTTSQYAPDGSLQESVQFHCQQKYIYNCIKINGIDKVHVSANTKTGIFMTSYYHNQRLVQRQQTKWGRDLIQSMFMDSAEQIEFQWALDSTRLIVDKDNGLCLYGFRNMKGDWVIPPKFQNCKQINHAYYVVSENNKYGVLDEYGQTIIPFQWDYLDALDFDTQFMQQRDWRADRPLFEPIRPDPNFRLVCGKGNLYGVIDNFGKMILNPVYQGVRQCKNDLYEIKIGQYWGIVRADGEMLVSPQSVNMYFTIHPDLFVTTDTMTVYNRIESKYGLVNAQNRTLLTRSFNELRFDTTFVRCIWVENRLFHADKGWLLDTNSTYRLMNPAHLPHHYKILEKQDSANQTMCGILDAKKYILLPFDYQSIKPVIITRPTHWLSYEMLGDLFECTKAGKSGIFDAKQQKWVLPLIYDKLLFFEDSVWAASYEGKYQFINPNGQPILAETFEWMEPEMYYDPFEAVVGSFAVRHDSIFFYNAATFPKPLAISEAVERLQYEPISKRYSIGGDGDGKKWHFTAQGKVILTPQSELIWSGEGHLVTRDKNTKKQQLIDNQNNKQSFLSQYEIKTMSINENWVLVQDTVTQKLGMVTMDGKTILPCTFFGMAGMNPQSIIWARNDLNQNEAEDLRDSDFLTRGEVRGHWQMYDKRGQLCTKTRFDAPFEWSNQLGIGRVRGKNGLWNAKGQTILPAKYDKIFYDTMQHIFHLFVTHANGNQTVGFANADGQVIIDANLKNMSLFRGGYAFVETAAGYGLMQQNGQYRIQPQADAFQETPFSIQDSMRGGFEKEIREEHYWNDTRFFAMPYFGASELDRLTSVARVRVENLLLEQTVPQYFLAGQTIKYQQDINYYFYRHKDVINTRYDGHSIFLKRVPTISHVAYTPNTLNIGLDGRYNTASEKGYFICRNFKFKNNIWEYVPLESILNWNRATESALNQLMLKKISALKHEEMDCGDPQTYMKSVKTRFYILPEGLQFLMARSRDNEHNFVPILFTWAELKPYLLN